MPNSPFPGIRRTVAVVLIAWAHASLAQSDLERGYSYLRHFRPDSAIAIARSILAHDARDAQAHALLGSALMRIPEVPLAKAHLDTALAIEPPTEADRARIETEEAVCCFAQGRYDSAASWLHASASMSTARLSSPVTRRIATTNSQVVGYTHLIMMICGLEPLFADWRVYQTADVLVHCNPSLTVDDGKRITAEFQRQVTALRQAFHTRPGKKIDVFVWNDDDEIARRLNNQDSLKKGAVPAIEGPYLRPDLRVIHTTPGADHHREVLFTLAGELPPPATRVQFINAIVSIRHCLTNPADPTQHIRRQLGPIHPFGALHARSLWVNDTCDVERIFAPMGAAFLEFLVARGGEARFALFLSDQSINHANEVYGPELDRIFADFDATVNKAIGWKE